MEGEVLGARGTRICWGVGCASLDELMDLPLRLAQEVAVVEDDAACDECGREVARFHCSDATLGEVLHGVFWALSFFGGQAGIDELLETLAFDDETPDRIDVSALLQRIGQSAAPRHGGCPR